jgi:hypothetical protein
MRSCVFRAATVALLLVLAACSSSSGSSGAAGSRASSDSGGPGASGGPSGSSAAGGPGNSTGSSAPAAPSRAELAADSALIAGMYAQINRDFRQDPNLGVRAVIAAQYPEAAGDVDYARCVNAISPRAKTLPRGTVISFVPDLATMTPDPSFRVVTRAGKQLQPKGRIYSTVVAIAGTGVRPGNHDRHQVVLDGKVYQFSSC